MALAAAGCGAAERNETAAVGGQSNPCPVDLRTLLPPDPDEPRREVSVDGPSWSPDGGRIAVTAEGFAAPLAIDVADCHVTELRPERGDLRANWPAWSPDGKLIAFANGAQQPGEGIFVMRVDGSGVRRLTEGPDFFPSWSPDGRRIAFTRDLHDEIEATENRNIWVVNVDGSGLRPVTEGAWHGSASW